MITRADLDTIQRSGKPAIERMRAVYAHYTPEGLQLLLESIIYRRIKRTEKALMLAVGLASLDAQDHAKAMHVLAQIQVLDGAEKLLAEIQTVAS